MYSVSESRCYYSVQPFLAWVLNEYFYDGTHYVYLAPFYPYRKPNPKSSSPYDIYGDLYRPWKDEDQYDPYVAQKRLGLRKGVIALREQNQITAQQADVLKNVCDRVDLRYFCPILYRVDLSSIEGDRLEETDLSAARGSDEVLIQQLLSKEFDVLLFDYQDDEVLANLFEKNDGPDSALATLKSSYASTN